MVDCPYGCLSLYCLSRCLNVRAVETLNVRAAETLNVRAGLQLTRASAMHSV